jgi:MoxR-like ATPase
MLADEINRTPPKTQAALLEAMQEHQVTAGKRHPLPSRRSSCWPRRTRSSRKAPTRCPRPSSTASCSWSGSTTRAPQVAGYALELTRRTRVSTGDVPDFIKQWVAWGAGPRAGQYLILGAKARAVLSGRSYVSGEDIRAVAHPVLRHRIITTSAPKPRASPRTR